MATAAYYPNSAGGAAWRGLNATQPGATREVWQDTAYSSAEKNTISTDDSNYVRQAGSGGNYPGHEVLYDAAEAQGSITQLDFTVKVAAGGPTIGLYLWNFNTSAWDSKASQGGTGKRTITFTLDTNITNYVDASGQWYLLAATPAVVNLDLYYEQVVVTFTPGDVEGALTVGMASDASMNGPHLDLNDALAVALGTEVDGGSSISRGGAVTILMVTDAGMDGAQRAIHGALSVPLGTDTAGGSSVSRGGALSVPILTDVLGGRPLIVRNAAVSIAMATDVAGGGDTGILGAAVIAIQTEVVGGGEKYLGGAVSIVMATDVAGGALVDYGAVLSVEMETEVAGGGTKEPFGALSVGMETDIVGGGKLAYGGNVAIAIQTEVAGGSFVGLLGHLTIGMQTEVTGGGMRVFRAYIGVPAEGLVRLWWGRLCMAYVVADGQVLVESPAGYVDLPADTAARMYLDVLGSLPPAYRTPHDLAALNWIESPTAENYEVQRSPAVGEFEAVATVNALDWIDGPLDSGTYRFQVFAQDAQGDQTASLIESLTISTAPDRPSGTSYTWNPATKTLAISWMASPSPSAVDYTIRSSEGEPLLDLMAALYATTALTTWSRVFTNQSGTYLFLVRARDALGREDANISQLVCITLENGAIVAKPAEPRLVTATAISGGRIELEWLYDPRYETDGPGAGYEARIYWDAGTGTMDWSEPYATVAMGGPSSATRFTWTSGALTNETIYQFAIRIGTAAWPAGIETANTDAHSATADADEPAAPVLSLSVV